MVAIRDENVVASLPRKRSGRELLPVPWRGLVYRNALALDVDASSIVVFTDARQAGKKIPLARLKSNQPCAVLAESVRVGDNIAHAKIWPFHYQNKKRAVFRATL